MRLHKDGKEWKHNVIVLLVFYTKVMAEFRDIIRRISNYRRGLDW
jgi:hypothetical protein